MDFQRAIIKCLFYDISPDIFLSIKESKKPISAFRSQLVSLLSKELPSFTSREMEKLVDFELQKISEDDLWIYPFEKVHTLSLEFLDIDDLYHPFIKNDNALRWNETTRYTGEDLFTCSRVAEAHNNSITYHWDTPLAIGTNNNIEVADIHFHMSSSYDAFDLAWIVWMNNFDAENSEYISQAAIIRYVLFKYLIRGEELDYNLLMSIFESSFIFKRQVHNVYDRISTIISPYINYPGGKKWDYAISGNYLGNNIINSPYSLFWGERRLSEHFFYKMCQNNKDNELKKIYPFYYLYNIIKINLRKEAILNNGLIGLKNFQSLTKYKGLNPIQKICDLYGLQTSSLLNIPVEARFGYSFNKDNDEEEKKFINTVIEKIHYCVTSPLLRYNDISTNIYQSNNIDISYVLSISKIECKSQEYLKRRIKQIDKQLYLYIRNFSGNNNEIPCTGIDFAGSDTLCRPFVFAKTIEKIRKMGCNNLTYHAGEDFFDLIDGIRTIDEILIFLNWEKGNRLGHCLSLFTDVDNYYNKRHYNMVLPKGILLDNLVWLLKKESEFALSINQSSKVNIENEVSKLYKYIYKRQLPADPYHELFNDPTNLDSKRYYTDVIFRQNEIITWQIPKDFVIREILKKVQNKILNQIRKRNIHIETCPTSNLLIGFFDKYNEIPTSHLSNNTNISVSINTDIKGSVGTSLINEYELVRLSLIKKGTPKSYVESFLQKIGRESINAKFKSYQITSSP